MQNLRLGLFLLAACGILATFFPWVTLPMVGSIAGSAGDGWITLVLFAIALALVLRGASSAKGKTLQAWGGISALLAGAIGVWKIFQFRSRMSSLGSSRLGERMADAITIGSGLYIVIVCGFLFAILVFVLNRKTTVPAATPETASQVDPTPGISSSATSDESAKPGELT